MSRPFVKMTNFYGEEDKNEQGFERSGGAISHQISYNHPLIKMTHFTEPIKVNRKSGYKKKKIVTKLKPKTIKLDPLCGVDISKWKVPELKAELKKRGKENTIDGLDLRSTGKKPELIDRLQLSIELGCQPPLPLLPTFTEWWKKVGMKSYLARGHHRLASMMAAAEIPKHLASVQRPESLRFYNLYKNEEFEKYKKIYPKGTKKLVDITSSHIPTIWD